MRVSTEATGGGVPAGLARELVESYGTPLYVYQRATVRQAVDGLRAALPPAVRIYYSLKANPHPLLVATIADAGLGLEISSTGELTTALSTGVGGDRCLYTGPGKTVAELTDSLAAGVRRFSVESRTDRDRLAGTAAGRPAGDEVAAEYLVRLNPGVAAAVAGLRMTGGPSQFGVPIETLRHDDELVRPYGPTRPVGFHVFSATNLADEAALLAELTANVATVAAAIDRTGFAPSSVDIGGGFGAPFARPGNRPRYPALRDGLARVLDTYLPGWRDGEPAVAVETGRHLVAEAGTLLTTVMDVKTSGANTYVVCDVGVNALGGMSGLGRLLPPGTQPIEAAPDVPAAVLTGPLCTPLDVLNRAVRIPAEVGGVLAIPNVGAYGLTASLVAFLGRPLPVEVVLDGAEVVDARRLGVTPTPV